MRHRLTVALLSALVVSLPAAQAQRGGGRAGGFSGGHATGSFGRSFGGFSSFRSGAFGGSSFRAGSFSSGPRFTSTAPVRSLTPFARAPESYRHDERGRDRYRMPYRGYESYGYPAYYANSWELLPWDLGYPDYTGDDGSGTDAAEQPTSPEQDNGYRAEYSGGGYPGYGAGPEGSPDPVAPEPELTLIFKDGHREEIHNYVLTQDTVIVMDRAAAGYQQRVPLATLNLPATEEAAEQAGLEFRPPA